MGKLMLDGVEVGLPDRSVTAGGVSFDPTIKNVLPASADTVQKAIDSATETKIYNNSIFKLRKCGSMVNIAFGGTFDTVVQSGILTPEGNITDAEFCPKQTVYGMCSFGGASNRIGLVWITTSGEIKIHHGTGYNEPYGYGCFTYSIE